MLTTLRRTTYTLESVYTDAMKQLSALKADGRLSDEDYEIVTGTTKPEEVLELVNTSILKNTETDSKVKKRLKQMVEAIVRRMERFGAAINMIVQSSPQILGLNLVGLIWGSMRFLLVVSGHSRLRAAETPTD
jgi:biopolymer transport protein ExbB/TolQ